MRNIFSTSHKGASNEVNKDAGLPDAKKLQTEFPSPLNTTKFLQTTGPGISVTSFKFIVSWTLLLEITQLVTEPTPFRAFLPS